MAIMEQQEHIATLCAASTLGVAATGFAIGIEDNDAYITTPGKRKWPGASSTKSPASSQEPFPGRRAISQPATTPIDNIQEKSQISLPTSIFRKRASRETRPNTAHVSNTSESRGSSLNRDSITRPRTADIRSTSERRDPSTGSSWLKRISIVSSLHSSPAVSLRRQEGSSTHAPSDPPGSTSLSIPNKLVKRSTSQRALSADQARGTFLRRPATSHQRTVALKDWNLPQHGVTAPSDSLPASEIPELQSDSPPMWRPFFERGYPRKRQSTGGLGIGQSLRTISTIGHGRPTLILGRAVEPNDLVEDCVDVPTPQQHTIQTGQTAPSSRQRLTRSLSSMHRTSRRRHFTEPIVRVNDESVSGTISPAVKQSPLSPVSNVSTFDVDLPEGSPIFTSSPNFMPARHRFSFRKRQSTAPSDPTTVSSDNDTHVFTDDDSMDCHSDTAFNSLATRATASSHSAAQPPKLDTIFNAMEAPRPCEGSTGLERLMQQATLSDSQRSKSSSRDGSVRNYGIGISGLEESGDGMDVDREERAKLTPIKSISTSTDEFSATPVPKKPALVSTHSQYSLQSVREHRYPDDVSMAPSGVHEFQFEEDDEIDWSPAIDVQERVSRTGLSSVTARTLSDICSSPTLPQHETDPNLEGQAHHDKRLSIFDWSEQQRIGSDTANGGETRPKTVHGKQVNDASRSRSSGRRGPTQLHLRSQSVPNHRDSHIEQTLSSTSKFSTWGLGRKPVSEEWGDDFEFDDVEEESEGLPQVTVSSVDTSNRGPLPGVKVPKAIMDRQASVHIQFGQVQEFMLLVEELKRLRAQGSSLGLLESHSKQLWDDAESIINLATINDEEDGLDDMRPRSPTASEFFGDEASAIPRSGTASATVEESKRSPGAQRSVSGPATPPHGRPRSESLAQAKNFLQTIHQNRANVESSPLSLYEQPSRKLPFDTQDLNDLVVKSSTITRALKEIIRKAHGVPTSPSKTPPRTRDPAFSQIFNAPDTSPCPPFRNPGLPKSRSANSYLSSTFDNTSNSDVAASYTALTAVV